jgi:hypothetical protein
MSQYQILLRCQPSFYGCDDSRACMSWADNFDLEEVKSKRSIDRDRTLIAAVKRLPGDKLLTTFCREDLFAYQNARRQGV